MFTGFPFFIPNPFKRGTFVPPPPSTNLITETTNVPSEDPIVSESGDQLVTQ